VLHHLVTMRVRTPLTVAVASLGLIALPAGESSATTGSPAERIAFTAMGSEGSIFTVNPDGSGLRKLVSNASGAIWSPDRSRLVFSRHFPIGEDFRGDTIYRADLYSVRPDGSGVRLLTRAAAYPTWSRDGQSIAFVRGDFNLWTVRVDGSGERQLVKSDVEDSAWSPDGNWIAFSWYAKNFVEVWLIHPDGTGLRRLVKGKSVEGDSPAWAPDGRQVSFLGLSEDGLYVVGIDGRRLRQVATANSTNEWSPVGQRILFERPNGLWVTRPDGRNTTRLALRVSDPDWSPNGQSIAFIRQQKIHVMNSDGTGVRRVTTGSPAVAGLDW